MKKIKYLLLGYCLFSSAGLVAQNYQIMAKPPKAWQLLDLKIDGVFGVSAEKANQELLKEKKTNPVIVAVLDGGVDVTHEDLKQAIWTNPGEIPGNGKDDDKNGFVDDLHGWNFYSTMTKGDEEFDLRELFKQAKTNPELQKTLQARMQPERDKLKKLKAEQTALDQILEKIGKTSPGSQDLRNYTPTSAAESKMQLELVQGLKTYPDYPALKKFEISRDLGALEIELDYFDHQDFDLVTGGPTAHHGTHVAGIIAGREDMAHGVKGIATAAKIMVIRTVPGYKPGAEQEMNISLESNTPGGPSIKRLALAIRYAADNGARVINMSFGKDWKATFSDLNEAIKYAIAKDVLIVHASGNFRLDMDKAESYPSRKTPEGQYIAANWIEVSASGWKDDETLPAVFSNYGKNSVDVYAPGVDITSTAPRNTYWTDSGTSMAAPVVSGLAALIRSYYPKLRAEQVKEIIIRSVITRDILKDKCISGGVVNAYQAMKLASTY